GDQRGVISPMEHDREREAPEYPGPMAIETMSCCPVAHHPRPDRVAGDREHGAAHEGAPVGVQIGAGEEVTDVLNEREAQARVRGVDNPVEAFVEGGMAPHEDTDDSQLGELLWEGCEGEGLDERLHPKRVELNL